MGQIVEVNEAGALTLEPEVLGHVKPHTRYLVERDNGTLVLRPAEKLPFWATATPEERARAILEYASRKRPPAPDLPDEALRRENIYD
ncbi:MAG: hypothetical protein HY321_17930 [Armatimonadetes bacterium]|nr:hypothetical protein [Armatimonadota bacterium]